MPVTRLRCSEGAGCYFSWVGLCSNIFSFNKWRILNFKTSFVFVTFLVHFQVKSCTYGINITPCLTEAVSCMLMWHYLLHPTLEGVPFYCHTYLPTMLPMLEAFLEARISYLHTNQCHSIFHLFCWLDLVSQLEDFIFWKTVIGRGYICRVGRLWNTVMQL